MLELRNITKDYKTGAEVVHALKGIDLAFRRSEFVSILGPSGCGKTTMLNILGGLDHYTDGDLIIDGISTKQYRDADWDAYRNDTIGFVFQSYNLISHQTVLSNVELALTLSGVSAGERRQRAIRALEQVGLGDQINKKPAQMSGGQVQRVAIARALINDPDIILADEPTGALDSETSLQIMTILKEISTRKLVIMVTHNPELAEEYSTRIVRLSDGSVISDTDPYDPELEPPVLTADEVGAPGSIEMPVSGSISDAAVSPGSTTVPASVVISDLSEAASDMDADTAGALSQDPVSAQGTLMPVPAAPVPVVQGDAADGTAAQRTASLSSSPGKGRSGRVRRRRNKSMSMGTALRLSLNNLMTKKARTLLTSFAGSIGIIGIALILSVSHGFQTYIDKLEEDTLSSYPFMIQAENADMTSMITAYAANRSDSEVSDPNGIIHEQQVLTDMLGSIGSNDLTTLKERLDSSMDEIGGYFNDYEYSYGISPLIYSTNMDYGVLRVSPGSIMQTYMNGMQMSMMSYSNTDVFFQMMDNQELLKTQYKVLAGDWPKEYNELLLVIDGDDRMNDYIVYTLGLRDPQELKDMISDVMNHKEVKVDHEPLEWSYDDFIGMEFSLVNACDTYRHNSSYDVWEDMSDDDDYMKDLIKKGDKLRITGIVTAKDNNGAAAMSTGVAYLPSLTSHMIESAAESDIVRIQLADKKTDVFSGKTFKSIRDNTDEGLGFEDMIDIDKDKLKSALGGDIDPNAVTKAIEKNAKEALGDLDPSGTIKSIMKALGTDAGGMMKDILSQEPDKVMLVPFDNDTIDNALGDNLDTGKHRTIVNKLLKGYATKLKEMSKSMQEEMETQLAQYQEMIENDPEAIEMIISQLKEQGIDITVEELEEAVENREGKVLFPTLAEKLPQSLEDYLKDESTINAVAAYAEGIALQETAKNVPPALVGVAKAVGSQFNIDPSGIADAFTMKMDEDEITRLITAYISGGDETSYESNLRKLGYAKLDNPVTMSFYLKDFESKEKFMDYIDEYNQEMQDNGEEDKVISYTDLTGTMIKSVKTITNAVSYVLIAFVAISLVVSSIMIGVITYISVLERTKEIGILRAIGASKRDISRIFNAETIIVGLCAGVIGIGVSLILLIPINKILIGLTNIATLKAILPAAGGVALIGVSIFLTFIAGLIPSGMAARKDPVEALRTE